MHMALRYQGDKPVMVDGKDVMPDVRDVLDRMRDFTAEVRSGAITRRHRRAVHRRRQYRHRRLGSRTGHGDAGARALHAAPICGSTTSPMSTAPTSHDTLKRLDLETTLFIVASKTFTTDETMTNAAHGARLDRRARSARRRCRTISPPSRPTSPACDAFGIRHDRIFGFWDWVGGRYSVWSAIGLPVALAVGFDNFAAFLAGAARDGPAFPQDAAREEPAGHHGPARRLVPQRLGLLDPRRAALRPAPVALRRLSAAAGHGDQRQVGDARRQAASTTRPGRSSGASRAPTASTPSTS